MSQPATDEDRQPTFETSVDLRCTGHVRRRVGFGNTTYRFDGLRLRNLLDAIFSEHDVRDRLIAETEADVTTAG